MATVQDLRQKWQVNCEGYKTKEIGSGVHSFIADTFESPDLFKLIKTAAYTGTNGTFVHDTEANKMGRPDFVLYINSNITIPVEAKCFTRINEGIKQLFKYQIGLNNQFGILTDGYEWRFYRNYKYQKFTIDQLFENTKEFLVFWKEYLKTENYYAELFNPARQILPFEEKPLDLNDSEYLSIFFEDTTNLIEKFTLKIKMMDVFGKNTNKNIDKIAVETAYAYLIQFILYKVLVDNKYKGFGEQYIQMIRKIAKTIHDKDFYSSIITDIKIISEYISKNVYVPFEKEQESITDKLTKYFLNTPTIEDISPWLDIIAYINKYNFANLQNEIFGFIYENYLKELYGDKNKGQYFTDRAVVNFMLKELGYSASEIKKRTSNEISIIDSSCGAGTFLYSAVDQIINAFDGNSIETSKHIVNMVNKNIFGLDIEEFPLYLAEMSILMRLLPIIITDKYQNKIDNKFKIFKTKDSISEFLNIGINATPDDQLDLFAHLQSTALDYPSFMREEKDLQEMIESMQVKMGHRARFDFVIGNPPYIGYNVCGEFDFAKKIKDKNDKSITMGNVYGVNLNTVPGRRKPYPPKPNLYAFFIALGFGLLKDNGKICYIIPQTILTAGDLDVLRYHLSNNVIIEKIITFEGNLFVGRGLRQNKPIPTSSLIFICKKAKPNKNHSIKLVNYQSYNKKEGIDFDLYLKGKNKKTKNILQSELRNKIENWNFIHHTDSFFMLIEQYEQNSLSIEEWRQLVLHNYDEFHFDVGYVLNPRYYSEIKTNNYYIIDFTKAYGYTKMEYSQFYPKDIKKINLTRNSRYSTLGHKYNIVWRIKNFQKFMFIQEPIIFNMGQASIIATDNKNEAFFFFSLLNNPLNIKLLEYNLKSKNEKDFLVAIKAIKQYVRIPKISAMNNMIKNEIIAKTEEMLLLEKIVLKDIVNMNNIKMQRFDSVYVTGKNLVLTTSGKETSINIPNGRLNLVKKVITDKYCDTSGNKELIYDITLASLKSLPVIDYAYQAELKDYIDDLVFALYLNIQIHEISFKNRANIKKICEKNEFYTYLKTRN